MNTVPPAGGEFLQYPIMPGRGIDSRQTGSIQEAAVMQSDADKVGSAVGGCAYKQATVGHKVVNLEQETADKQHGPSEEKIRLHFLRVVTPPPQKKNAVSCRNKST